MRLRNLSHVFAASALITAPVAVSAAPVANPAASLSLAKSVRAEAPTEKQSQLFGGGIFGAVILAGIIAIGVIAIVNDSEDDSDSP